ncbi:MAG TPA: Gfo/Idh/MocA family oxidoreductase [Casimicrobiaceae bacterium]|nr:Gfo/Idh/MocA family oxidoreductase [Casimicrobiaceae bacterium]
MRIGILGAARIARLFVDSVRPSTKVAVVAIAARDATRARAFAAELGIPRVHASYESLLADPELDAIYNPLPNTLHAEWSIRALGAGKHVLCEKPLAMSSRDADAMFAAARSSGRYLVEGYPYRAQPQTVKLRELLASGAIGTVQVVQASFGFPMRDLANIRYDPALGGGALTDAGSYPVSLVRMIAGERPRRASALAQWSSTGVDRALVGLIEFPGGLLAEVSCSFGTARHRHAVIIGDAGMITTTFLNDTSAALPPRIEVRRGTGYDSVRESIVTAEANGFRAEADAFADLVRHGWSRWPGATPEESADTARILEALATSARDCGAIDIAP